MGDVENLSVAERYNLLPSRNRPGNDLIDDEDELANNQDYRAFISSRQPMDREDSINFAMKTGMRRFFSYSHLYGGQFDPDGKILLLFSDNIVVVKGERLLSGFHKILDHRIRQVKEADAPTQKLVQAPESVVNEIQVHEVTPENLKKFGFVNA